jgi:phosphoribosylformimino-5-aminoimidazole carboxamide ribotide isomerase
MKIYPAIDILGGNAVRLKQGLKTEVTLYGDPLEMASKWVSKGAEWLHVVDLDGAFEGSPKNLHILREMVAAVPGAKIQVGGGIRKMSVVDVLLNAGVRRIVLGTAAVQDQEFVKHLLAIEAHSVAMGIDARDGFVQVSGWTQSSSVGAIELARRLQDLGAEIVIYTDISRDGVMQGPNIEGTRSMLENTNLFVIASGGVSSVEDARQLSELNHPKLDGVIIGKALYEGRFEIEEVLALAG